MRNLQLSDDLENFKRERGKIRGSRCEMFNTLTSCLKIPPLLFTEMRTILQLTEATHLIQVTGRGGQGGSLKTWTIRLSSRHLMFYGSSFI